MALPNLFGSSKTQDSLFLSIYVADSFVQAGLWGIRQSQVELITKSEPHQYQGVKEVSAKTDEALQALGEDSEKINKVVFGFDPSWIRQTSVVDEHKAIVKAITTDLSLEPLGFVSTSESLVQQLISVEIRLTAIIIFFHQDLVSLFLIRKGKLITYVDVPRTEDPIADVREGMTRLVKLAGDDDYLPSRLLLVKASMFDTQMSEKQTELVAYDFSKEQRFIDQPKMEVLPIDTVFEAITRQGGLAVAKLNGLVVTTAPTQTFQLDGKANAKTSDPETDPEFTKFAGASSETTVDAVVTSEGAPMATSFGLPVATSRLPGQANSAAELSSEDPTPEIEFTPIVAKKPVSTRKVVLMSMLIGLVTVVVGGFAALWFFYQVTIKLALATEPISDDVKITLDPAAPASDPDKLLLKAELITRELSDTLTQETTGIKLVGDKAKGTIVIYNKTSSPKTFAKNTVFEADKLKYVLVDEVQVASASVSENSSGDGEQRDYGKAEATIEAADIGAQANIAKDAQLKVASFDTSTYTATVKEGLTGGSSREVRVVSAEDQQKLQKELTETLNKKAAATFKQESVDGKYIIPSGKSEKIAASFDVPVAKEADNVSLSLTIKYEGVVYAKDDVKPLALAVLGSQVKEGYQLIEADPEILSTPGSTTSATTAKVVLDANVSSKIKPIVTADEVKNQLKGLTTAQALDKLRQRTEFKTATLVFNPGLARMLLGRLPVDPQRIQVEISE